RPGERSVLSSGERQCLDQGAHAKGACTRGMERTSMALPNHLQPIPHPPGHLFVGNLFDLDANHPIESMIDLAREYVPIFQIDMPGGNSRVVVSGFELVDELCDESRFDKMLGPGLRVLGASPLVRGLFTSETADPNWHKAHNILLPAFSMDAMRHYHPMMLDIAVQL